MNIKTPNPAMALKKDPAAAAISSQGTSWSLI